MRSVKFLALLLLLLALSISLLVACGECAHQWNEGYVAKEATDKEVGQTIFTCNLCGVSKSEEIPKLVHNVHDYSKTTWGYDDKNHWLVCEFEGCTVTSGKGIHLYADNANEDGLICLICRSSSTAHTFTDNMDCDGDFHWIVCDEADCPTKKSRLPHTFDESGSCTGCGYSTTVTE